MVKRIKNMFNEDLKKIKTYEKEIIQIKELVSKYDKIKTDKQKYILKELKIIKKLFNNLDYNIEEDNKKIHNIFIENKIHIIALFILASKSIEDWKLIPYDSQIIGILAMLDGELIEMKTGEGKSFVSFIVGAIKSLYGASVNIISINHFLINRDYNEFKPFAEFLNISMGIISQGLSDDEKREEYSKSIVYSTHQDIIFDYLKDNMFLNLKDIFINDYYFAIIDEIDAILIDSALTPIMFSIPTKHNELQFKEYLALSRELEKDSDNYDIQLDLKTVELTKKGITELEKLLNISNIYISKYFKYIDGVQNSLKSIFIFKNKEYYIIENNKIIIVDSTTGRPISGRTFPSGIQQAIEAKEGLQISKEDKILASITYQNFFKLFKNIVGLTGTLMTEKDEFFNTYKSQSLPIERRIEEKKEFLNDLLFKTYEGKLDFLVNYIKEIHNTGQPLLIGAVSVERAEQLSKLLLKESISHNLITAANHKEEANIIKSAGEVNAITIVTSMAGRGTDIKVSEEANKLGGLFVIGMERGQNRRIDNQLSGRVGRNGDYGTVLFLISPDDDLIIKSEKRDGLISVFNKFYKNKNNNEALQATDMIVSAILKIQESIENNNYETRKYLLNYDRALTLQRNIFYRKRREILSITDVKQVENLYIQGIKEYLNNLNITEDETLENIDFIINQHISIPFEYIEQYKKDYLENINVALKILSQKLDTKTYIETLLMILINNLDNNWAKHLTDMSELKTKVAFFSYIQRDPLSEYNKESHKLFGELFYNANIENIKLLGIIFNNINTVITKEGIFDLIKNYQQEDDSVTDEKLIPYTKEELELYWNDLLSGDLIDFSLPEELRPLRKHELSYIWSNIKKYGFINNYANDK